MKRNAWLNYWELKHDRPNPRTVDVDVAEELMKEAATAILALCDKLDSAVARVKELEDENKKAWRERKRRAAKKGSGAAA